MRSWTSSLPARAEVQRRIYVHKRQVKEGNLLYISLDPAVTDARFFKDTEYQLSLDYRYFNDYGDFVIRLMEKINNLYSM